MNQIEENNKIIAEFLGWKINNGVIDWIPVESPLQYEVGYSLKGFLQFHTSWDWLMPVVEKIENLGFSMLIGKKAITLFWNMEEPKHFTYQHIDTSKIETIWLVVVEFIKWYNKQKNE